MAQDWGHAGSWWGLPDFKVTETIADFRDKLQGNPAGSGRTDQGGSDLDGSSAQQKLNTANQNLAAAEAWQPTPTPTPTPTPKPTNPTTRSTAPTGNSGGSTQNSRLQAWLAQGGQGDVPVGWNPNDQNGNGADQFNQMLEDAYNGVIGGLNNWAGSIQQGRAEDESLVGKQYMDSQKNLDNQKATEQAGLDEQGRALWESFRKSMGTGAQNYAQRLRGLVNLYGLGNSTGQTMSQLLANKQAEVEGNLQEQRLSGERALSLEGVKLARYIDDKKNQLDTWKQQALTTISQNVRDKLNQINMMKHEAESNKTNAKIALLQQTIAAQKQIEAQDMAVRQSLAQWSVQQLANVQQDNFDVSQVPQVYYNTMNQLNSLVGKNPAQASSVALSPVAKNTDEFASLMG
jgi:hypothetical protein